MIDVLVPEPALARIASRLAERCAQVRAIAWHADGSMTFDATPIDAQAISPKVGWISADVLSARQIEAYCVALTQFPAMAWVQSANAGLDHPVYPQLAAKGIRLSKSSAQSIPIAEYVLAYALVTFQGFDERRRAAGEKRWSAAQFRELWQSNWLIIGFGHIGRGVAVRARAFDARVVAVRRSQAPDEAADVVTSLTHLYEHLPDADVVVLACPATEETRGLAGADFFAAMAPGALLVNVARGSLVDETALLAGLDRGTPGHAVLDVFEHEPLPGDSRLWTHPQVTVTAHTSNAGNGTRGRGDELFLANLTRFLADEAVSDEVDPSELTA